MLETEGAEGGRAATEAAAIAYTTSLGTQYCGDSRTLLKELPAGSVDLIITSPPFALLRKKSYGNKTQTEYSQWLAEFGELARRVLRDTGSLVIELGGAYKRGRPVRSIYNYRVLIEFCDTLGYELAEEFFWFNPAKLPSPIEWVNKRKIRAKDAVSPIWWFSKTDNPKADVRHVLVDYSPRMRELLRDPEGFYKPDRVRRPINSGPHSRGTTAAQSPRTCCGFRTHTALAITSGPARSSGRARTPRGSRRSCPNSSFVS